MSSGRLEELVAALLANDLASEDRDELNLLRAQYPWLDAEISALGAIVARLRDSGLTWFDPTDIDHLRQRVMDQNLAAQIERDVNRDR